MALTFSSIAISVGTQNQIQSMNSKLEVLPDGEAL
jgi:hypothetical protein